MTEHVAGAPVGPVGYVEFKCRCDECKDAYYALGDTPRQRRINGPTPSWLHGTWNAYSNYGCRCERCLEVCRKTYDYAAAWRRANRAKRRRKGDETQS